MDLYTADIVLKVPSRGLRFDNPAAIRRNCLEMFGSMADVEIEPEERFATEERQAFS